MHPRDCPGWEYDRISGARATVRARSVQLLIGLRADANECSVVCADTRPSHASLYQGLTPAKCDYYAGHYRGEDYRCLKYYRVQIQGDPMVGYDPELVLGEMQQLETTIRDAIAALDKFVQPSRSRPACLIQITRVAARVFELFLRIHPYANGNGHMGRLIVCALFGRYGFWMNRWTVEPRPQDPPYSSSIAAYRRGYVADLEKFLLECAKWGEPAQQTTAQPAASAAGAQGPAQQGVVTAPAAPPALPTPAAPAVPPAPTAPSGAAAAAATTPRAQVVPADESDEP